MIDPLVVKDSFLRGSPIFSQTVAKDPLSKDLPKAFFFLLRKARQQMKEDLQSFWSELRRRRGSRGVWGVRASGAQIGVFG